MGQRGRLSARILSAGRYADGDCPELCPPEPLIEKHSPGAQGCRDRRGQGPVSTRGQPHTPRHGGGHCTGHPLLKLEQDKEAQLVHRARRREAADLRGREGTLQAPLLSAGAESTRQPARPPTLWPHPCPTLGGPAPRQQLWPVPPSFAQSTSAAESPTSARAPPGPPTPTPTAAPGWDPAESGL